MILKIKRATAAVRAALGAGDPAQSELIHETDTDDLYIGDGSTAGGVLIADSSEIHAEAHTVASHSDTTATGTELETLTDGSNADALHVHAGGATNLSEGTSTETTVDVDSSTGTNATLASASTTRAGLLTKAKWDEIVANTSKDTNVTTNLSEGTATETTVDVNSSDGTNATLVAASTSRAGLLTKAKFDEIVANTSAQHAESHTIASHSDGANAIVDADFSAAEGFMRKTGAGAYEAIKSNLNAAVAPDANDDSGDGYVVGSRWIDTTADKEYVCLDATSTAAVWTETTAGAGGGDPDQNLYETFIGDTGTTSASTTTATLDIEGGTGITTTASTDKVSIATNDGAIDHNSLLNHVANEHIDWTNATDILSTTAKIETTNGETWSAKDIRVAESVDEDGGISTYNLTFCNAGLGNRPSLTFNTTASGLGTFEFNRTLEATNVGQDVTDGAAPTFTGTNITGVPWDGVSKTGSDLADLATKSHTALSDIGTNTHAQIDTHIGDAVTGPASATDNAVARFDGTTGKTIQNGTSVVTIDDDGNTEFPGNVTFDALVTVSGSGSQTVDFTNGNKAKLTPTAAITGLTLTFPGIGNYMLHISNASDYAITFTTTVKWPGGTAPDTNDDCLIAIYYDGTTAWGTFSEGMA